MKKIDINSSTAVQEIKQAMTFDIVPKEKYVQYCIRLMIHVITIIKISVMYSTTQSKDPKVERQGYTSYYLLTRLA